MPRLSKSIAVATGAALLCGSAALAQEEFLTISPNYLPNYFGIGIGGAPDYVGSDNYFLGGAPFGRYNLGGERYIELDGNYLSANLLNNRNWQFGPAALYRFGRDDSVDDDAVSKMPKIDDTVELGFQFGYQIVEPSNPRSRWRIGGNIRWDVGGEYDGFVVDASVRRWMPLGKHGALGLSGGLTYGSDNYTSTFFSVSDEDSLKTGMDSYDADGGMRSANLIAVYIQPISEHWLVGGGGMYTRMVGDAGDSPITDDRGSKDQFIFGAGVAYTW